MYFFSIVSLGDICALWMWYLSSLVVVFLRYLAILSYSRFPMMLDYHLPLARVGQCSQVGYGASHSWKSPSELSSFCAKAFSLCSHVEVGTRLSEERKCGGDRDWPGSSLEPGHPCCLRVPWSPALLCVVSPSGWSYLLSFSWLFLVSSLISRSFVTWYF